MDLYDQFFFGIFDISWPISILDPDRDRGLWVNFLILIFGLWRGMRSVKCPPSYCLILLQNFAAGLITVCVYSFILFVLHCHLFKTLTICF